MSLEPDELVALAKRDAENGRLEEALVKLKPLLGARAPAEALPLAGRIYAQLNLLERAKACFQGYVSRHPEAVQESFELGMTHFQQGEDEEARRWWRAVLERSPAHPPALYYSGVLAARAGRASEAQQHLDALVKAVPADNFYAERGRELLQQLESGRAAH